MCFESLENDLIYSCQGCVAIISSVVRFDRGFVVFFL